ncbi:hypothetical protein EYS14_13660 [Alteromonadaceae bacterium M269]|nr:hypothetical protein EYS14_13660 [Alteromonadaceae bacterium M269]
MFKKCILVLAVLISCATFNAHSHNAEKAQTNVRQVIKKHAKTLLSDERFHSVSIGVYFNGEPYSEHFGELTIGESNRPDDSTLYEIASVSKTMTGLVTAKAVIEGKLSLDADINQYLPQPLLNLSSSENPITIRHILTHRSGIPQNLPDLSPYIDIEDVSPASFLEALNNSELKKTHGEYQYSNIAPDLLAYILETVYETTFEALLIQTLKELAGMKNSKITLENDDMPHFAYGYNEVGKEMPAFTEAPKLWGAAGRVKSTLTDMLKYIALQLEVDNPIVKESHKTITSGVSGSRMGYFWQMQSNKEGIYLLHHGGLYGTQNWIIVYPQYNLGISIISNVSFRDTGNILRDIADSIIDDIKPSGTKSIRLAIQSHCIRDVDSCIKRYYQLKKDDSASYAFDEDSQLNTLGYRLLGLNKVDDAIKIFKLQVAEFPSLSNPFDSLAEAYYVRKDYAKALINYKKSLSLDASNSNAKAQIKSIEQKLN